VRCARGRVCACVCVHACVCVCVCVRVCVCACVWPLQTHAPSALRLLLIACASFRRCPCAPDSLTRSLPARSIRFSTPDTCVCACVLGGGRGVCVGVRGCACTHLNI
jgi:hypothetical protein